MATKEEIVVKIMKLMELGNAEKNDNPNERATATRMAAKLMAEYSINFADLRDGKPSEDAFVTYEVEGSEDYRVDFEGVLANVIAQCFDCKIINLIREGPWRICFVGSKHDLEISVYFFKHVRRTMYSMAARNVTEETVPHNGRSMRMELKDARRNYCLGMVTTISDRLKDLYQKREEYIPSDCKALMVVKKKGLDDFFDKQFPRRRKGRQLTLRGDMNSYRKGEADGHKVNLTRPISGSSGAPSQIG